MINLIKIVKYSLLSLVLLGMSPFILYFLVMSVWRVEYTFEKFFKNQAIDRAASVIEPLYVDGTFYDITTVMIGVSNSEVEYSREGDTFSIDSITYHMDSGVFHHFGSAWLYSYNREEHDIELINDICTIINGYDLDYKFIEGYGYRGFYYGDGYVYGRYDEAFLNGQYIEISLRPIEGKNTVLRFDLELDPDSIEYQLVSDLKAMEHAQDGTVSSVYNVLGLITPQKEEEQIKEPQILVIS